MKNKIKNFVADHHVALTYLGGAVTMLGVVVVADSIRTMYRAKNVQPEKDGWVTASISPEFAAWIRTNPPIPWEN